MRQTMLLALGLATVGAVLTPGRADAQPTDECGRYPMLYADDYYRGRSLRIDSDIFDLHRLGFGDEASSICVPRGWRVVVYEDSDLRGDGLELAGPEWVSDLKRSQPGGEDWGDRISSVRVFRVASARGRWGWSDRGDAPCARTPVLYADDSFNGRSLDLTDSVSNLHNLGMGDEASSVCVPSGWILTLYEHTDFRGDTLELRGPASLADLARERRQGKDWGDRISSVRVDPPDRFGGNRTGRPPMECQNHAMLYVDDGFRGRSMRLERSIEDLHRVGFGDAASSLCVPRGWRLVLYEDSFFRGRRVEVVGPREVWDLEDDQIGGREWGDRISSVEVLTVRR